MAAFLTMSFQLKRPANIIPQYQQTPGNVRSLAPPNRIELGASNFLLANRSYFRPSQSPGQLYVRLANKQLREWDITQRS